MTGLPPVMTTTLSGGERLMPRREPMSSARASRSWGGMPGGPGGQ